jgi:hypothetical protein
MRVFAGCALHRAQIAPSVPTQGSNARTTAAGPSIPTGATVHSRRPRIATVVTAIVWVARK